MAFDHISQRDFNIKKVARAVVNYAPLCPKAPPEGMGRTIVALMALAGLETDDNAL